MARTMKNSGIAWIGEIPDNWSIASLKRFSEIKSGDIISKELYIEDGEFPIVGSNGIIGRLDKYNITESVLTTGRVGTVGTVHIFDKAWITDNALIIHTQNIYQKFVYYVIPLFDYQNMLAGTAQPLITATKLNNQKLPIPSFEEQQKIANYLDNKCQQIDSVLEKTKESIEEYKKLKNAVITQAVTKGIKPNRKMKDSGIEWIGEIPEDWEDINPKALFTQRKEKAKNGEKQLTASQQHGIIFQDEYMELTGARIVTVQKDFDILKHVESGDFVISMRSFQGGLEYSTNTGSISSAYVMLIPNLTLVFPRFFRWLLKSEVYINALQSTSNLVRDGQAMRYSNFAQIRLLKIPLNEQKEIADYLDKKCSQIDNLISKKEQLITELETYKKSLIYEYVTGKKEVK